MTRPAMCYGFDMGFPKVRGTFLGGVPMTSIIVFWGLHMGPP